MDDARADGITDLYRLSWWWSPNRHWLAGVVAAGEAQETPPRFA
jgi:hypothetical protein